MAQERDSPTPDQKPPPRSAGRPSNPARRILLGGIPIAVTLASRPALALTQECSVSNALSGNLSHPLPSGVNCGLTPLTWCNLAGTNQLWPRTAMYPQTTFISACGGGPTNATWTCGSQSLLASLQGSLVISCKIGDNTVTLNAQLFGEHASAGILNAAAFAPNNYSKSLSEVLAMLLPIWATTPTEEAQAQAQLDAVTNQLAPLNINT